jgi:hypothetical protein
MDDHAIRPRVARSDDGDLGRVDHVDAVEIPRDAGGSV